MSSIRIQLEEQEEAWLAPAAAQSRYAIRRKAEQRSAIRTEFQRDRDRIIHTTSFRRLQAKTQVFLPPAGDHIRSRLTHTLEVMQIARTISRALRLNEDLTEAIALGHDLGHTPFGHAGEEALAKVFPDFRHNHQSLRIVDVLENNGRGLNLTDQVRDGILKHSKPESSLAGELAGRPATAEAQVVKISDSIAYINHDLDDAIRHGVLRRSELPGIVTETLGARHSTRIDRLVNGVVSASASNMNTSVDSRQVINMNSAELCAADTLRTFLFEKVYRPINQLAATRHAQGIVQELFQYFVQNISHPALRNVPVIPNETPQRRVADFVAGMTDQYARQTYNTLFSPTFEEA